MNSPLVFLYLLRHRKKLQCQFYLLFNYIGQTKKTGELPETKYHHWQHGY